ncbi:hypothetical protein KC952_03895 [Candidatus Saccharibacteria bacterium]|nr:hypothetical protein [Candidatus Saccharibacteria bacterium]
MSYGIGGNGEGNRNAGWGLPLSEQPRGKKSDAPVMGDNGSYPHPHDETTDNIQDPSDSQDS